MRIQDARERGCDMIDKVSVVVADIDGTINIKGSPVMPHTRRAIDALHERGVLFGTASGRPLDHRTLDKAREWGLNFEFDLAIGMNGGDLWDKDHEGVEHMMQLDRNAVRRILEFMWPLDCNCIVYENAYDHVLAKRIDKHLRDSMFRNGSRVEVVSLERMCAHDTGKIECQYDLERDDEIMAVVRAHPSPLWDSVRTFPGNVEFVSPGLDKGVALRRYAARNGVELSEVMAFGDMDNDIALLSAAGWGVCMRNGSDACKAVSDAITEFGVTEDGMGRYLEEHVLPRL
jgi:Cof subfamily protein (haloacid dehalogenase superfamily)